MIAMKAVIRGAVVLGRARTRKEAMDIACLPCNQAHRLVEGPNVFEIRERVIVRVQVDLTTLLVYNKLHGAQTCVPFTEEMAFKLHGRAEAFFYAQRAPGGWTLEEEAPWQSW